MLSSSASKKTDRTEYRMRHYWIEKKLGRPSACANCEKDDGSLEWSNKSGEYRLDTKDWERLCPSCHRRKDLNGGYNVCNRKHELTLDNTYTKPNGRYRECRECRRLRRTPTNKETK
jgi:hypothetical protein